MARHLIYHVMPIAGNGIWQWNVSELIKRLPLFDGQRTCAIVTQHTKKPYTGTVLPRDILRAPLITDPAEKVIEALKPHGFKFVVMENRPDLGEVATFYPLMKSVKPYTRPDDITLYAHAKGVTRFWQHPAIPWTRMLYETMLDYWPVVNTALLRAPVAGSFLKWGKGWEKEEPRSLWHYSGSWFWFRNACLFTKPDWWRITRHWYGIECYPSLHFDDTEAAVIFHEGTVTNMETWKAEYMEKLETELSEWKQNNVNQQTSFNLPEFWCPTI